MNSSNSLFTVTSRLGLTSLGFLFALVASGCAQGNAATMGESEGEVVSVETGEAPLVCEDKTLLPEQPSLEQRSLDLVFELMKTRDLPYSESSRRAAVDASELLCQDNPEQCHFVVISSQCGAIFSLSLPPSRATEPGKVFTSILLRTHRDETEIQSSLPVLLAKGDPVAVSEVESTSCSIEIRHLNGMIMMRRPFSSEVTLEELTVILESNLQKSVINARSKYPRLKKIMANYEANLRYCAKRSLQNPRCALDPEADGCPNTFKVCRRYEVLHKRLLPRWWAFRTAYSFDLMKE